jgi:hypothetical protein
VDQLHDETNGAHDNDFAQVLAVSRRGEPFGWLRTAYTDGLANLDEFSFIGYVDVSI